MPDRIITVADDATGSMIVVRTSGNGRGPAVVTEVTLSAVQGLPPGVVTAVAQALLGPAAALVMPRGMEPVNVDPVGGNADPPDTDAEPVSGDGTTTPTLAEFSRQWRKRAGQRDRVADLARHYGRVPTTIRNWRNKAVDAGHRLD